FGSGTFDGSTYGAVIASSCVGNPASFTWGGGMLYDPTPGKVNSTIAVDFAPDGDAMAGPVLAPAALDPAAGGYWLVGSDGGIFSFNSPFSGSTGAITLNKPIVGMAADPDHKGYWLVASDGGVFAFGDAPALGSALGSSSPVVGIAVAKDGLGYSIVRADGSVVDKGSAPLAGSLVGHPLSRPIVGVAATV